MMDLAAQSELPLHHHISDPPYENYFFADPNVSCQAVLSSPTPNFVPGSLSTHRLLFAWPAGNSGAAVFFKSVTKQDNLRIRFIPGADGRILDLVKYEPDGSSRSGYPSVGVSGLVEFSDKATLDLAILGSVRTLRDYTEGHGILNPKVQESIRFGNLDGRTDGLDISRTWFDGKTTMHLTFALFNGGSRGSRPIAIENEISERTIRFAAGLYSFQAHLDYPQLPYINPAQVLKPSVYGSILEHDDAVKSLAFLCSSDKILAGAWRFLTYFGRDSMISLLLLNPILSEGQNGTIEAGLSAMLERIDHETGKVCHEEIIGDYPTAQAALSGHGNPDAQYDYKMIDTDFFLPIVMKQYFIESRIGQSRLALFLNIRATLIPANKGKSYGELAGRTCRRILEMAKPFAEAGGNTDYRNLIALEDGCPVGQWRDSDDGLGGGRYPYDVNTALMPAALRAIAELAGAGALDGLYGCEIADELAEVWETSSLEFFNQHIARDEAQRRVEKYKEDIEHPGPSGADQIGEDMCLQAIALKGDGTPVVIMNTDACFRLFLLPHLIHSPNPTSLAQHLLTLDCLTASILRTFPAGLSTPVGILIANPAFSTDPTHARTFTSGAYHGTVVWAWNSLAMLARGLEAQLSAAMAAEEKGIDPLSTGSADPESYRRVRKKMKQAYTKLWDTIEGNKKRLSSEVWSWRWGKGGEGGEEGFVYTPLGCLPTPDGRSGQTESNAVQLWSLAFLAMQRRRELEL